MPTSTTFVTPDGMKIIIDENPDSEDGCRIHHFELTISMPGMSAGIVYGTHVGLAGIEIEAEFSEEPEWP